MTDIFVVFLFITLFFFVSKLGLGLIEKRDFKKHLENTRKLEEKLAEEKLLNFNLTQEIVKLETRELYVSDIGLRLQQLNSFPKKEK